MISENEKQKRSVDALFGRVNLSGDAHYVIVSMRLTVLTKVTRKDFDFSISGP